jgi:hypothetical protein
MSSPSTESYNGHWLDRHGKTFSFNKIQTPHLNIQAVGLELINPGCYSLATWRDKHRLKQGVRSRDTLAVLKQKVSF